MIATIVKAACLTIDTNATNLDFSGMWEPISRFLAADHAGFFDDQHDPDGEPWKPLAVPSIDSRWLRQLGGGKVGSGRFGKTREAEFLRLGFRPDETILIDSGALRISVTYLNSPHHVEHRKSLSLDWGTNIEYAAQHQFGAVTMTYDERAERWREIEVPPRPFLGFSKDAVEFAVNNVADQVVDALLVGL